MSQQQQAAQGNLLHRLNPLRLYHTNLPATAFGTPVSALNAIVAAIAGGQKIQGTVMNNDGTANKQMSADRSIVPKVS